MATAQNRPIFVLLADIAKKDGVSGISKLPGLWERRIDDHWEIAVNGHNETIEWPQTKDRMGCRIESCHCAVMFNGCLAGILNPYGGIIAAGKLANEQAFIEALEKIASPETTGG